MSQSRSFAAAGALLCGLAVALAAIGAHTVAADMRPRMATAAAFAFAHGLALIVLRTRAGRLALAARVALLLGVLLFAGNLALAAFQGGRAPLAPLGGTLLLFGWLLAAIDFLRKD